MELAQNKLIGFGFMGMEAEDKITGFSGIVTSISFDLYGCVQAVLTPKYKENEKAELQRGTWFDTRRLKVISEKTPMEVPDFTAPVPTAKVKGGNGGYDKPDYQRLP